MVNGKKFNDMNGLKAKLKALQLMTVKYCMGLVISIGFLVACKETAPKSDVRTSPKLEIDQFLQPLGGLEKWKGYQSLSFSTGGQNHLINLKNRNILVEQPGQFQLGFDGENLWVAPNQAAFDMGGRPPRFFYSLLFYFFSIPFVYADPGVIVERQGLKEFDGKPYEVVKVTFKPGTGDSPKDVYLNYFDPSTKMLQFLLYTVTYHTGAANEDYYATIYDEWQQVDGLTVPKKVSYAFLKEEKLEVYMESQYDQVEFKTSPVSVEKFLKPEAGVFIK